MSLLSPASIPYLSLSLYYIFFTPKIVTQVGVFKLFRPRGSHLPHDYPPRQMNRMTSASVLFSVFDCPTRNTDTGREHVAELKRGWQMLHRIKTREIREPDLVRWSDRVLPRHPISVLQSRTPWEM
ncbi:predicted protein [Histoplasma capsulatum G186AR]|uniref:Uncharacterized protein n=1 Tax=Ajellomyces capsulatus (strain G186AR / H82 / ATCC MYA-2454 / RMSCC 2432) TaxID=447093 RepID=C0NGU7_AJECG|nr:uncharacterized protein HCBG_02569 [Histoplasma capsulatum G186AR]EEH09032.1 predicted protein [Histoplasma capsulatum G186AR]